MDLDEEEAPAVASAAAWALASMALLHPGLMSVAVEEGCPDAVTSLAALAHWHHGLTVLLSTRECQPLRGTHPTHPA